MDIEKAINHLIASAASAHDSADALRFSQAAANVAHAKHALAELEKPDNRDNGKAIAD